MYKGILMQKDTHKTQESQNETLENKGDSIRGDSLRKIAEEMLRKNPKEEPLLQTGDVQKIVHELDVHQAELEIQNEEMRHSQMELSDSRDRYEELYDFAPVGYLTLDHEGLIINANLTAEKMIGFERGKFQGANKFSTFVSPESQDTWHKYRREVLECKGTKKTCELDIVNADRSSLSVSLQTICTPASDEKESMLMMAVIDISERKRAEKELTFQASLLANTNDAVIATDLQFLITYWNQAAEKIYGWTASEVLGKYSYQILRTESSAKKRATTVKTLSAGETIRDEYLHHRKDGSFLWIEATVIPLDGAGGKITGYASVNRDITERKLAEAALRESEERLRFALETIHIGAWDLNLVDHTAYRSLEHDRIFGYEELLPQWTYEMFLEHVIAEDRVEVDRKFQKAVREQSDWNFECRIRRKDGQIRWILAAGRHRPDSSGAHNIMSGIVQDITGRKLAEEKLIEQASMLAIANDAVIGYDSGYRVTFWNKAAETIYGFSADEAIGRISSALLKPEYTGVTRNELMNRVKTEGHNEAESVRITKDGRKINIESHVVVLRDAQGTITGYVAVDRDITERKRAEEALREAQKRTVAILEGIADTFYSLDDQWRFTVVNPAAEKAPFGRPAAELLGKVIWDLYPKLIGTPIQKHYLTAAAKSTMEHYSAQSPLNGRWYEVFMQGRLGGVDVYMRDITERKQAEEALQRAFQRFYLILSNINSGILLVGDDDRIEFANQAFCNMFGLEDSPSDLLKLSAKEMLEKIRCSYLDPGEALPRISEIVRLGQPVRSEDVGIIGGRSLLRDYIPIRLGEKQYGRLWIHLDITERKRAEIALLSTYDSLQTQSEELQAVNEELQAQSEELQTQSEELHAQSMELHAVNEELRTLNKDLRETRDYLDKLLNYANAPVIVWNPDMRITRFNRAFEKLTGYSAEKVIGLDLDMLFPPESRKQSLESIARASKGEYWETVEIPIRCKDGDIRIALWNSANILADDGTLVATIAQGQDITSRRHAEEALRESEERYRILFNSMTEGFALHEIICNDNGIPIDYRFLDVNSAFEKLTGLRREDVIGRTHNEILPDDNPRWLKEYGRVALTGEPVHFEDYSPLLERHYEVFAYRPLPNKFAVLFMDITERIKAEERIAKLTRLYIVLSLANETIVRTDDEGSLYSEVCRIVAEAGGFPLVWIGLVDGRRITPAAWFGPESDYLKDIRVEIAGELGKGPSGTSIRENRSVVNDDFSTNEAAAPWRESAKRHGFCASASFPLRRQGQVIGALTIYAAETKAFDAEQVGLLESLSSDISFALETFEQEKRRSEAEEALRETRDYLDKLLNYANAPVIVWDPDMRITLFNKAFEKLTGYSSRVVIGRKLAILFPRESKKQSLESIARASKGEYWEAVEIPIRRKDGEVRIALWNSANITASDGMTVAATIAQGQDITERKHAEEEIERLSRFPKEDPNPVIRVSSDGILLYANNASDDLIRSWGIQCGDPIPDRWRETVDEVLKTGNNIHREAESAEKVYNLVFAFIPGAVYVNIYGLDITERKKAEEAVLKTNKELEQFAYVASHDLQEPLRSVNSFTDLLARRYKDQLDERANEYIGFIVSGASRMQQLIQDLLSFSRAGRVNIERSLINCNTIVDRISSNMKESREESGAEITRDDLPVLFANDTSLTQLFQNLITNAVKFHREGIPPRVHVSAQKMDNEWLFSVKDNGIGINRKYFDKLFVIFQRLHARDEYPGTGIGLAICKKIVESYGGRIWVESKEGEGSTFYFTFPA
jgi:PAS domain S-box-containing protein